MADSNSSIGSGGDHTSLSAWYSAKSGETGTHTGRVLSGVLTGNLTTNNPTATAWILKPDSGAEHDGTSRDVSGSGAQIVGTGTGNALWIFNTANFTIQDLDIKGGGTTSAVIKYESGSTGGVVQRNIIHNSGGSSGASIEARNATTNLKSHSNICYDCSRGIEYRGSGNAAGEIVGNTVLNCGAYGILGGTVAKVAANISVGHSTEDYFDTNSVSGTDYNIAADASANTEYGSNSINSVQVLETGDTPTANYVAFVKDDTSLTTVDLHLVDLEHGTYSNVAIDGAVPVTGWTTDIDGDARDASTPEIGADEMAAAAAATLAERGLGRGILRGIGRGM